MVATGMCLRHTSVAATGIYCRKSCHGTAREKVSLAEVVTGALLGGPADSLEARPGEGDGP